MKRSWVQIFFSYLLLFYFIGFVVPPVSALLPSAFSSELPDGQFVPAQRSNQKDLMLIDLALWELLNRTKRNEEQLEKCPTAYRDKQPGGDHTAVAINFAAFVPKITVLRPVHCCTYSSIPRSIHSGLSPPIFA